MIINVLIPICVPDMCALTLDECDLGLNKPVYRNDPPGDEAPITIENLADFGYASEASVPIKAR